MDKLGPVGKRFRDGSARERAKGTAMRHRLRPIWAFLLALVVFWFTSIIAGRLIATLLFVFFGHYLPADMWTPRPPAFVLLPQIGGYGTGLTLGLALYFWLKRPSPSDPRNR